MKWYMAMLALGVTVLLLPTESIARKIATHGNLTAHVDDNFVCGERATVRVEAVDPRVFSDPNRRMDLERLFATARAGFEFDCTTHRVETVYVKGYVHGVEVYRGIGSAGADWVLLDVPYSAGKAALLQMQERLGQASSALGDAPIPKTTKELSTADRLRLFGEKGERAFKPLLVKAYGYRAQLMDVCKPNAGKQAVLKEMVDFYSKQLPAALPTAQALFDSYTGEKGHYLPVCDSPEYKTTLAWNEKELTAHKNLSLELMSNCSQRVVEIKQHLSQLGFYKGQLDDALDEPFLGSLKTWFKLWYFGPVERQRYGFTNDYFRKALDGLEGKLIKADFPDGREVYTQYANYGSLSASDLLIEPIELALRQSARKGPGGIWMFVALRTGALQQTLRSFGYYRGELNGLGSKEVEEALKAYSNEHPELRKKLGMVGKQLALWGLEEVRNNPNQMNVRLFQQYLVDLGWLTKGTSGHKEGVLDLETIHAVQSFQKCKILDEEDARQDSSKSPPKGVPVYIDSNGVLTEIFVRDLLKIWNDDDQRKTGRQRLARHQLTGHATCEIEG